MSQYFNLKVKEVVKETEDAVTLRFQQPEAKINYKPGQFLTLILTVNGEKVRRSYSLCSYPEIDEDLAVTVKRVVNGKVSNYILDNIREGDVVEVMEPMGTFTIETDYHKKRNVVLLGAGSGITPLMSIAKAVLTSEPLSTVFLFYGNRNEKSIILKKQLEQLNEKYNEQLNLVHVLSQPLNDTEHHGRLNRSMILKLLDQFSDIDVKNSDFYICGPKGMMEEAEDALSVLKVPAEHIHRESFLSTPAEPSQGQVVSANQKGPKEVTIIYEGTEYKVTVSSEQTILEAALDQDIDLPYSCQSGMCTACMGKCTSGKVHLDDPDGLSKKEIEQGFVLTCVGHPVSGDVIIEID